MSYKVTEAQLLVATDIKTFNEHMNQLLTRGWKLWGSPFITPEMEYGQMLVRVQDFEGDDRLLEQ